MKVLEQPQKGISAGSKIDLGALGLSGTGGRATLLVFWKRL
jgi:hypothetical protein